LASRPLATRCLDLATYAAVRVLICVIQALPRATCERGARRLSSFLANRLRIRRQVVRDNLRTAFPEFDAETRRETARKMWEHLLLMVVEIAHANRVITRTTWRHYLHIHGMEDFVRLLWLDRPKVVLSGHFGNFELAAYLFGLFGFRVFSVARELDNPLLDRFVTEFRESRGQRILPSVCSATRRPGRRAAGSISSDARRASTRRSASSRFRRRRPCSSARQPGAAGCSTTTCGWRAWPTQPAEARRPPTCGRCPSGTRVCSSRRSAVHPGSTGGCTADGEESQKRLQ